MTDSYLHWSNNDPLNQKYIDLYLAGRFRGIVTMSNLPVDVIRRVKSVDQNARILCRLYHPQCNLSQNLNSLNMSPWFEFIEAAGSLCDDYVVLNEPEYEHGLTDADRYVTVLLVIADGLRSRYPSKRFGFPLPAVTPRGYGLLVRLLESADTIRRHFDFVAEHCYWETSETMASPMWGGRWQIARQFGLPVHITEYGWPTGDGHPAQATKYQKGLAYRDYLTTLGSEVLSAAVFIAGWAGFDDRYGEFIVDSECVRGMQEGVGCMPEFDIPLAEQFPNETATWLAAGGRLEADLLSHLVATGKVPATAEIYDELAQNIVSHVEELRLIGHLLPKA